MPNPHISTQDWFYHVPTAKSKGPSCVVAPVPSQIPGLSNIPEDSVEDKDDRCFRRKWIRDTDSKYVKLAKAGGRRNLLAFNNKAKLSSEPVLYPRVEWFDHINNNMVEENEQNLTTSAVLPEWYVHEQLPGDSEMTKVEGNNVADISAVKRPMLGFDAMSVWQRENENQPATENSKSKLPKIRKKKFSAAKAKFSKEPLKLPKLKSDISSSDGPQDMKKLLSMDYQREWLVNKSLDDTKEMKSKQMIQKEKRERDKRIADRNLQSLKPKKEKIDEKPLFKLSRFNKVKSCVDTRWSKLESPKQSAAH